MVNFRQSGEFTSPPPLRQLPDTAAGTPQTYKRATPLNLRFLLLVSCNIHFWAPEAMCKIDLLPPWVTPGPPQAAFWAPCAPPGAFWDPKPPKITQNPLKITEIHTNPDKIRPNPQKNTPIPPAPTTIHPKSLKFAKQTAETSGNLPKAPEISGSLAVT